MKNKILLVYALIAFSVSVFAVPAPGGLNFDEDSGAVTPVSEPLFKLNGGYCFQVESSSPNRWLGLVSFGGEICLNPLMLGVEYSFGQRRYEELDLSKNVLMLSAGYHTHRNTHFIFSLGLSWSEEITFPYWDGISFGIHDPIIKDYMSLPIKFSYRKCICLFENLFASLGVSYIYEIPLSREDPIFGNSLFTLKVELQYSLINKN